MFYAAVADCFILVNADQLWATAVKPAVHYLISGYLFTAHYLISDDTCRFVGTYCLFV